MILIMFKKLYSFIIWTISKLKSEIIRKRISVAALMLIAVSVIYITSHYISSLRNMSLNKNIVQKYEQHSSMPIPVAASSILTSRYPAGMLPDFYKLYDTNPDIKGWISIPQTVINYPVMQSTDNNYYLHNNFSKTADEYGSLFLDYRDEVTVQSQNMIIYGHNMKDGQMFNPIVNYQQTDFYKASSLITFNTIYGHYSWKVFAAFITNTDPKDGYVFNYLVTSFPSDMAFNNFIKEVRARSLINTPSVDVKPGDTILTLSTCYYSSNDARFVVMARRVRPGETTSIEPATRNKGALSATLPMHN